MTLLSPKQLCEYDARAFHTDEVWKRWKQIYDEAMTFRKSLKGKPTDEQREQLNANADWIDFCDRTLWHSTSQAKLGLCVCKSCDERRKGTK